MNALNQGLSPRNFESTMNPLECNHFYNIYKRKMGKKSMSVVDSIVEFSESDNATFETPARHTQLVERKKSKKDLVMLFGDQTVKNIQSVTFREVTFQNGEVQYCLNDPNNQSSTLNVGSLKRKNLTDSGNEYLVAYVNKKTKKATFKPVELISMSSQVVGDKDAWLKGEIAVKNVDYGTNNAIKTDEFLSKRNNLTNDFGSTKKRQMLNDVDKRRVDQDTMLALADTAFSSITNMDKKVDHNVSGIAAITSMEKQTQGNILPKFNGDAKKPENIYPVDQFISEENYNELSELSVDFFESKETEELATLGVSKMIIALISSLRKQSDKKKFGYLLMKCHIMFKIAISVGKSKRYYKADEVGLPDVPADFRSLVEHEFFGDCEPAKTGLRLNVLTIDKLIAHTMVLYLIINQPTMNVPISTLSHELGLPERRCSVMLENIGCMKTNATISEEMKFKTKNMATLKNVPGKKAFFAKKR